MSSLAQLPPIWCDYNSQYWLEELPILMVICLLSHIDIVGYGQVNTSIGEVRRVMKTIFVIHRAQRNSIGSQSLHSKGTAYDITRYQIFFTMGDFTRGGV